MVVGAANSGVTGLATDAVVGVGSDALTVGQQAGLGAFTGCTNGALSSVAYSIEKVLLDKEEVLAKKYVKDFFDWGKIGSAVGAAGGAITGGNNLAATHLDEVAEMAVVFAQQKIGFKVLEKGTKTVAETVMKKIGESSYKQMEEKIEESF